MDAFATIDGHRLRYRLEGEGPLVVFAHGLLGSIEQIARYTDALEGVKERVRLLLFDARGHGQSGGPEAPEGYSWERLGTDMIDLVRHAGEERAIFAGASMGAAACLWAGVERPESVRALVLLMPPPLGPDAIHGDDERQALQVLGLLAGAIKNFGLDQTIDLARGFLGNTAASGQMDEQLELLRSQNPDTLPQILTGLLGAPRHEPEDYASITAPTLVMGHEGDGLHPARSARLLAERIPNARLAIGEEPGYWQSHPEAFLAEVDAFLGEIS